MQETLIHTTGALHLSKFHWLLDTTLWFSAHGALVSIVERVCKVVKGPYHNVIAADCIKSETLLLIFQIIPELFRWLDIHHTFQINLLLTFPAKLPEMADPSQRTLSCLYCFSKLLLHGNVTLSGDSKHWHPKISETSVPRSNWVTQTINRLKCVVKDHLNL